MDKKKSHFVGQKYLIGSRGCEFVPLMYVLTFLFY